MMSNILYVFPFIYFFFWSWNLLSIFCHLFSYYWVLRVLYIFRIQALYQMLICKYILPICGLFLKIDFEKCTFIIFVQVQFINVGGSYFWCYVWAIFGNNWIPRDFLLEFFRGLGFILKSIIHFALTFACSVWYGSICFVYLFVIVMYLFK